MKSLRALPTVAFHFLRGHRGGATGFAAAAVVMMLLGGGALISDHVWLVGKRDLLQSAADAASVATTQRLATLPGSMTDAEVHAVLLPIAERYARINVLANVAKELEPDDVTVVLAVDRDTGTVEVRVSADIGDTLFSKWLYDYGGPGEMESRAGTEYAMSPAEVVLVLDTTRSMLQGYAGRGTRIRAVRDAARDLVDILDPTDGGVVAIGLVPWATQVRLPASARADWVQDGWVAFPERRRYRWAYELQPWRVPGPLVQSLPRTMRGTWAGCVDEARILEGIADLPLPEDSLDLPAEAPFAEGYFPPRTATAHTCLGDAAPADFRRQNCWDTDTADPSRWQYPTREHMPSVTCASMSPILPLTSERTRIDEAIAGLEVPGRKTYSAVGVQWGRRLLSPEWRTVWGGADAVRPADPDDPEHAGLAKVLVLLTDGGDNLCEGATNQDCPAVPRFIASLSRACTDAKDEGIEIYVVAAMPPNSIGGSQARRFRARLTACASSTDHVYINNPNPAALHDSFRDIAKRVSKLQRVY